MSRKYYHMTNKFILFIILLLCVQAMTWSADIGFVSPVYVKSISEPYERYNDINPSWSHASEYISFERYDALSHEIVVVDTDGKLVKNISTKTSPDVELSELLPELSDSTHFSFNMHWATNSDSFVFVSNGKTDNFDIYSGDIADTTIHRLTTHNAIDNQVHWAPNTKQLAFISSRQGKAGLMLYNFATKKVSPALSGNYDVLNPVWSPTGDKIALMIGDSNRFQIYVIDDIKNADSSLRAITNFPHRNNIRPSWSPDGKHLAFFSIDINQDSNLAWQLLVVDANNNSQISKNSIQKHILSDHVIQNSVYGPCWLPDNKHIAYIQYIDDSYNPIHIVNTKNKKQGLVITNTKINRDLSCSPSGMLAFQSQDKQWSRIFIAKLPGYAS